MLSKYIAGVVIVMSTVIGAKADPALLASWRCAGNAVYDLKVAPDGTFKSEGQNLPFGFVADLINFDQYRVNAEQERKQLGMTATADLGVDAPNEMYLWKNELLSFDEINNVPIEGLDKYIMPYDQVVDVVRVNGKIKRIEASVSTFVGAGSSRYSFLFSLNEEIDGWKFSLSTQSLTTKKEAQELTIFMAGKPNARTFSANSMSFLTTGDCYVQN